MAKGCLVAVTAAALAIVGCSGGSERSLPVVGSWEYLPANDTLGYRESANYAWTGKQLFEWGGFSATCGHTRATGQQSVECSDGSLLDPVSDTWTPINPVAAPSERDTSFVVWTGTEVFVWSGDTFSDGTSGAMFDPAANSWRSLPTPPAGLVGRAYGTTVWTGKSVVVWGGYYLDPTSGAVVDLGDGASFDPAANAWSPISTIGAPSPRARHSAVWTGSRMIIWGGIDNQGAAYDPASDTWTPISSVGAPSARQDQAAVWTGNEMVILGGSDSKTGGSYDPLNDTWRSFNIPAPGGFYTRWSAAWTGSRILTWGWTQPSPAGWGGLYDPAGDTWEQMAPTPMSFSERVPDVLIWTGTSMLLWAGTSWIADPSQFNDGALYTPPTSGGSDAGGID